MAKNVAKQFNISEATVARIRRTGDKLLNADGTRNKNLQSKTEKRDQLDKFLVAWVQLYRSQGFPITGPIVCQKAQEIDQKYGIYESFKV